MADVAFILDAPSDAPIGRIQVAKTGKFKDRRYGRFEINNRDFEAWKQNLALFDGRVPIDTDHASERGGSTRAAGWIVDLDQRGADGETETPTELWATVEWTPHGVELVKGKEYRYISPAFGPYRDESGEQHNDVLTSVALTNKPFLDMAAVCLSRDPFAQVDETETVSEDVPDNLRCMGELANISKRLGLDEASDEATILSAIDALEEQATAPADEPKTLDALAAEADKIVLDKSDYAELRAGADAGREAREELRVQKFELAYGDALANGRVDAKDETRERFRSIFDKDEDTTIALLSSLPVAVKLEAQTSNEGDVVTPSFAKEDGYDVDPDGARLLARVDNLVKAEGLSEDEAIQRVLAEARS